MSVKPGRDHGDYYCTTLRTRRARARSRVWRTRRRCSRRASRRFATWAMLGITPTAICAARSSGASCRGPRSSTRGGSSRRSAGSFIYNRRSAELATPEYWFADTRDEMRKAIRENAHFGATLIKIVVDDQRYIYSPDDIRFMKDESGKMGMRLAAHAWTREGSHNAAEAGVASIEHGMYISDEDLALAKKTESYWWGPISLRASIRGSIRSASIGCGARRTLVSRWRSAPTRSRRCPARRAARSP